MASKNDSFVTHPHPHDVLTTDNGKKVQANHKGNVFFLKQLVADYDEYSGLSLRVSMDAAMRLVNKIQSRNPPGRYLCRRYGEVEGGKRPTRWEIMSTEQSIRTTLRYVQKVRGELDRHKEKVNDKKRSRNGETESTKQSKKTRKNQDENPFVIEIDIDSDESSKIENISSNDSKPNSLIIPRKNDFLFGEDGNAQAGNMVFHRMLVLHKTSYLNDTENKPISEVEFLLHVHSQQIVHEFTTFTEPEGRFLTRENDCWVDIGKDRAITITYNLLANLAKVHARSTQPSQPTNNKSEPMLQCQESSSMLDIAAEDLRNKLNTANGPSQPGLNAFQPDRGGPMQQGQPQMSGLDGQHNNTRAFPAMAGFNATQINMNTHVKWQKFNDSIEKQIRNVQVESFRAQQLQQQYATRHSNAEEHLRLLKTYHNQMKGFRNQFQQQQNAEKQQEFFHVFQSMFEVQFDLLRLQHKQQVLKQKETHREEIKAMENETGDQQQGQRQSSLRYLNEVNDYQTKWRELQKSQEQLRELQRQQFEKSPATKQMQLFIQQQMTMNRQQERRQLRTQQQQQRRQEQRQQHQQQEQKQRLQSKRLAQQMIQPPVHIHQTQQQHQGQQQHRQPQQSVQHIQQQLEQKQQQLQKQLQKLQKEKQQQQQLVNVQGPQQPMQQRSQTQKQSQEIEEVMLEQRECIRRHPKQKKKETVKLSNFQSSRRWLNPDEHGIQSNKSVTDDSGLVPMKTKPDHNVDNSITTSRTADITAKLSAEIDAAIKETRSMTESINSKEEKALDDQQDRTGYESDGSEASLVF